MDVVGTALRLATMALSVIVVLMRLRGRCSWFLQKTRSNENRDVVGSSHQGRDCDGDEPIHLCHTEQCKNDGGTDIRNSGSYRSKERNAQRVKKHRGDDKLNTENEAQACMSQPHERIGGYRRGGDKERQSGEHLQQRDGLLV